MALFKSSSEFCDAVSLLAHCTNDNSYLFIQSSPSAEFWIPSSQVTYGSSIIKQLALDTADLFGNALVSDNLIRIYKFWLPNTQSSMTHYIYAVKVDNEQKKRSKQTNGTYKGKVNWIQDSDLFRIFSMSNMRSPELFEMIMCWKNKTLNNIPEIFKTDGIQQSANFMEMSELVLINQQNNSYDELVLASPITKTVQTNLYREFLVLCFPSFFMGLQTFCKFFSNLGWTRADQMDLFRAADILGRFGVSFRELVYITAAVEPTNKDYTASARDARNKFLFRFYDKDNDGVLRPDEVKLVFLSIRRIMKESTDPSSIQTDFTSFYNQRDSRNGQSDVKPMVQKTSISSQGPTKLATAIKYEIGANAIKILVAGTLNIDNLISLEAVSTSSKKIPTLDEVRRTNSVDQFNQESITNELLKSLRYMNLVNKQNKHKANHFTWGTVDSQLFAKRLISICKLTNELVKNEPRLIQISSPVYVLGDLHGNFNVLLQFESVLWHVGPVLCPSNILFLGDYVDRGASSIEVISYLFSYKVQNPHKIKLVRGNHEIREVQKMFTFGNECNIKFGDKLGCEVWSAINSTFDSLPIAAIVDNSIFCCHGGIPPPWLCPVISCINDVPIPLYKPDEQSALAWEIMWNDPIRTPITSDALKMELAANEGFAVNKRRGTAHMFSAEALDKFLKSNGLTHLIRAHEVSPAGFSDDFQYAGFPSRSMEGANIKSKSYSQKFQSREKNSNNFVYEGSDTEVLHKGKLITIFSSSKYCGGTNDAACVMIDQGRIRIMRIESE